MGLDVYAYRKVELVVELADVRPGFERDPDLVLLDNDPAFVARGDGLASGYYRGEGRVAFRGGAYISYNVFRDALAELVGQTCSRIWAGGVVCPFSELVDFSDAEGFFGPVTSKKLAADFREHRDRVRAWARAEHVELYGLFQRAFEHAASEGKGVVKFS